jgi:hypothetical protein
MRIPATKACTGKSGLATSSERAEQLYSTVDGAGPRMIDFWEN